MFNPLFGLQALALCWVALMVTFTVGLSLRQSRFREQLMLTISCGLTAIAWMYCFIPNDFAPTSCIDDCGAVFFGVVAIVVAMDAARPDPPSFVF